MRHFRPILSGFPEKPIISLSSALANVVLLASSIMKFGIPMEMVYNGTRHVTIMGPFETSPQREFALTVNKRAIADCSDIRQLKEVAGNLLVGWSSMQTAAQSMMLENLKLRQALDKRDLDLEAANALLMEASTLIDQYTQQLSQTKKGLWSWWK
jgi:hypothetical protein